MAIPLCGCLRYDQYVQACQRCHGPIREERRADASYCSTSCKLKAQRRRKIAEVRRATAQQNAECTQAESARPWATAPLPETGSEDRPWAVFSPLAPIEHAQQLAFAFAAPERHHRDDTPTVNDLDAHGGAQPSQPQPMEPPSPVQSLTAAFRKLKLPVTPAALAQPMTQRP